MTSVLNVDSIAAKDGTSPVTLTKQQAAKFWMSVSSNQTSLDDSFNCSSSTDVGTGQLAGNLVNSMSNTHYAQNSEMMAGFAASVNYARWSPHTESGNRSTSQCRGTAGYEEGSSTAFEDFPYAQFTINGDLA